LELGNSLKDFGDRQRENFSDLLKNLTTQTNQLIRKTRIDPGYSRKENYRIAERE